MAKQRPQPEADAWPVAAMDNVLVFIFSIKKEDHWLAKLAICQQLVKEKAQAMWPNKTKSQSPQPTMAPHQEGSEQEAENPIGHTYWNSLYDSMEVLSEVFDTKLAKIKRFEEPRLHNYRGHQLWPPLQQDGKELESWCLEKQRNKLLEQAMFPALSRAA
ncbi:hypothetical protein GWK47_042713 [Chionoecetes opilio]|uniref:Uncharacterized protein n=1 Tax=Chionoecetes opilio TaxID=41210 RepID=A0A8J5D004_CHIOP|nr:hypothetical protein GWK47_042713 [Chionoecetes opilio]